MAESVTANSAAGRAATIEAKKAWREHLARGEAAPVALRIGVAASFTADTLVPFCGAALLAEGTTPAFEVGPYNQLFQTCLDPQSSFHGPTDVIVLLWRLEDLMLDEITAIGGADAAAVTRAGEKLDALIGAVRQLRATYRGMVIVGLPPYPTGPAANILALDNGTALGAFHRTIAGQLRRRDRPDRRGLPGRSRRGAAPGRDRRVA